MNEDLQNTVARLEAKIDAIHVSVEKTRKYFQITLWVTVVVFVLPFLALIFVIPAFLTTYLGSMGGEIELLNSL